MVSTVNSHHRTTRVQVNFNLPRTRDSSRMSGANEGVAERAPSAGEVKLRSPARLRGENKTKGVLSTNTLILLSSELEINGVYQSKYQVL